MEDYRKKAQQRYMEQQKIKIIEDEESKEQMRLAQEKIDKLKEEQTKKQVYIQSQMLIVDEYINSFKTDKTDDNIMLILTCIKGAIENIQAMISDDEKKVLLEQVLGFTAQVDQNNIARPKGVNTIANVQILKNGFEQIYELLNLNVDIQTLDTENDEKIAKELEKKINDAKHQKTKHDFKDDFHFPKDVYLEKHKPTYFPQGDKEFPQVLDHFIRDTPQEIKKGLKDKPHDVIPPKNHKPKITVQDDYPDPSDDPEINLDGYTDDSVTNYADDFMGDHMDDYMDKSDSGDDNDYGDIDDDDDNDDDNDDDVRDDAMKDHRNNVYHKMMDRMHVDGGGKDKDKVRHVPEVHHDSGSEEEPDEVIARRLQEEWNSPDKKEPVYTKPVYRGNKYEGLSCEDFMKMLMSEKVSHR
jgi:hypothetical protein